MLTRRSFFTGVSIVGASVPLFGLQKPTPPRPVGPEPGTLRAINKEVEDAVVSVSLNTSSAANGGRLYQSIRSAHSYYASSGYFAQLQKQWPTTRNAPLSDASCVSISGITQRMPVGSRMTPAQVRIFIQKFSRPLAIAFVDNVGVEAAHVAIENIIAGWFKIPAASSVPNCDPESVGHCNDDDGGSGGGKDPNSPTSGGGGGGSAKKPQTCFTFNSNTLTGYPKVQKCYNDCEILKDLAWIGGLMGVSWVPAIVNIPQSLFYTGC